MVSSSLFEITNDMDDRYEFADFIQHLGAPTSEQFTHYNDLSKDQIVDKAFQPNRHNFFLRMFGELIGYGFFQRKKHVGNFGIVIKQRYQHIGYGQLLLEYMIKWAKADGITKIWGGCFHDNDGALKLYKKLGFVCEGCFLNEDYKEGRFRHMYSLAKYLGTNNSDCWSSNPSWYIEHY